MAGEPHAFYLKGGAERNIIEFAAEEYSGENTPAF